MKVTAIRCKKCNDIIYSRARHDFRWCFCNSVAIDGGRDYTRIVGNKSNIEIISLEVEATPRRLYEDYSSGRDKFGLIR